MVKARYVEKIGGRGEVIFGVERYDSDSGERIRRGWQRRKPGDPHFTLPALTAPPKGMKECFASQRPGTYLKPEDLPGTSW